jgi:hypothetical protein
MFVALHWVFPAQNIIINVVGGWEKLNRRSHSPMVSYMLFSREISQYCSKMQNSLSDRGFGYIGPGKNEVWREYLALS